MYAIIATGGKQYKVFEGDLVRVEKLDAEVGSSVTFEDVVAIGGETMKVADEVRGATVTGTVVKQDRAKKITVYHYKPKKGFHKKNGHRQAYTAVKIEKING